MWAQRPSADCTLSPEAPRRLIRSRETDREHLTTDLASVNRIARQYAASTPSDDQQHSRFIDCEGKLIQQIASTYGVSPGQFGAQ
jgi:hypothetical protein